MEMQTEEVDVFAFLDNLYQLFELVLRDSELVLIQSCSDVFMCVRVDIRIDSD